MPRVERGFPRCLRRRDRVPSPFPAVPGRWQQVQGEGLGSCLSPRRRPSRIVPFFPLAPSGSGTRVGLPTELRLSRGSGGKRVSGKGWERAEKAGGVLGPSKQRGRSPGEQDLAPRLRLNPGERGGTKDGRTDGWGR